MIFLYSRKSQIVLLLCWCIGMTFAYTQITGESLLWLPKFAEKAAESPQKALIGQAPEPLAPAPVQNAPPAADPDLNRCLALRVKQHESGSTDTLVFELDYVAAQTKGYTLAKTRGYYLDHEPAYVVALGEPWTSDIGNASFPVTMPHVTKVDMIVSKTRNLRVIIHTRAMDTARAGKLRVLPTKTGMRAEVRLPH